MIVDVHHHYADGSYYEGYEDFPARLIEAMDRYGWDRVCLNGLGPAFRNRGNREVIAAVRRFPDRVIGIGYVDPDNDSPSHVDELLSKGMRGLKIIGTLKPYDHDDYLPFYERAAHAGMPILFHTGFLGGNVSERRRDEASDRYRPMTLDRIARLFPELPMIAAHMGTMIWYHEAVAVMCHRNVYADTSGGPAAMRPDFYRMPLNDHINWKKVVFGSDCLPNDGHIPFNQLKELMNELTLDEETQQGILGITAARIFGL